MCIGAICKCRKWAVANITLASLPSWIPSVELGYLEVLIPSYWPGHGNSLWGSLCKRLWKSINNYSTVCAEEVLLLFLAWRARVKGSSSGVINKILRRPLGFFCLSFIAVFLGCWFLASKGHRRCEGAVSSCCCHEGKAESCFCPKFAKIQWGVWEHVVRTMYSWAAQLCAWCFLSRALSHFGL